MMKKFVLIACLFFACMPILAQDEVPGQRDHISTYLHSLIDTTAQAPVVNILCRLESSSDAFSYTKGFGFCDLEEKVPVSEDQPFKIASITKMFTAVIIMQLYEEGKLDLDGYIWKYLGAQTGNYVDSLHVYQGGNFGKKITVRHLLGHRSGMADIFTDREDAFMAMIMESPQKQWDPQEIMHTYFELDVNQMALFEPGKGYHYTDTGYVLLGYCIQELTGKPLAQNFRERIIEPLKLSDTYLEFYEKPEEKRDQAHAYMGSLDVTALINTSFDWAGGGLVSTTEDLTTFIKALFELKLFRDPELLQAMMAKEGYGLGMGTYTFGDKMWYGHTGYWGSALFYQPEDQLTICITFNQVDPPFNTAEVIRKLAEEMR